MKRQIGLILVIAFLTISLFPASLGLAAEEPQTQSGQPAVAVDEGTATADKADKKEAAQASETPSPKAAEKALATPEKLPRPAPAQVQRGGLLIGAGKQEFEYRLSYAHFSSNTIFIEGVAILPVIVVGQVAVERIRRNILIGSWTWRMGLRDDLQVELRVPGRYQHDRSAIPEATPPQETVVDDQGIGDITGALYYELPQRRSDRHLIAGLEIKSRTGRDIFETTKVEMEGDTPVIVHKGLPMGTGFWSAKLSLTGVRVSDPAALFWNVGYTRSLPRDNVTIYSRDLQTMDVIPRTVKVTPGATYDYGFGLGYALNPNLGINAQFQQSFTQSTRIRDPEEGSGWVAGSTINVATLRLGATWKNTARSSTDLSVTFGLTEDSPDTIVEIRKTFQN